MDTKQLVKEYQQLDMEQRKEFLIEVTELDEIINAQFKAAKDALSELERGEFATYDSAEELINDIK